MKIRVLFKDLCLRFALLGLIWWFLTGGTLFSWILGIPALLFGVFITSLLPKPPSFRFRIAGVFPFLAFFFWQFLLGAFDVAFRAFRFERPVSPCLISYKFRLSNPMARIVFTTTIGFLPCTLGANIGDEEVSVHILDENYPFQTSLRRLETRVAGMFMENLTDE